MNFDAYRVSFVHFRLPRSEKSIYKSIENIFSKSSQVSCPSTESQPAKAKQSDVLTQLNMVQLNYLLL